MNYRQNEIIIFLGPTLSLAEAQRILPHATYLPPVQCGDMLRALRLQPKIIAIIDGLFETRAAVWHKEILLCLERGIHVYGASSMGALRAAELAHHGMVGVGKIFQDYYHGRLNDDDEVAVIHTPSPHYLSLTDAMVNVRTTLDHAVCAKILGQEIAALIADITKNIFYRERTFDKALEIAQSNGIDKKIIARFRQWLHNDNYVDLKKRDAIELLKYLADNPKPGFSGETLSVHQTAYLRALQKNVMCSPLSYADEEYQLLQNLAYLLAAVDGLANAKEGMPECTPAEVSTVISILLPDTDGENDLTALKKERFFTRMARIQSLLVKIADENLDDKTTEYLFFLLKLRGYYVEYKQDPKKFKKLPQFKILKIIATIWPLFDFEMERRGLIPVEGAIKYYTYQFRRKYKLLTKPTTKQWLLDNDLTLHDYRMLVHFYACFSFLILENNLEALGIFQYQDDIFWLEDAMRLSGLYLKANIKI